MYEDKRQKKQQRERCITDWMQNGQRRETCGHVFGSRHSEKRTSLKEYRK